MSQHALADQSYHASAPGPGSAERGIPSPDFRDYMEGEALTEQARSPLRRPKGAFAAKSSSHPCSPRPLDVVGSSMLWRRRHGSVTTAKHLLDRGQHAVGGCPQCQPSASWLVRVGIGSLRSRPVAARRTILLCLIVQAQAHLQEHLNKQDKCTCSRYCYASRAGLVGYLGGSGRKPARVACERSWDRIAYRRNETACLADGHLAAAGQART
jgi:hypothetical protein